MKGFCERQSFFSIRRLPVHKDTEAPDPNCLGVLCLPDLFDDLQFLPYGPVLRISGIRFQILRCGFLHTGTFRRGLTVVLVCIEIPENEGHARPGESAAGACDRAPTFISRNPMMTAVFLILAGIRDPVRIDHAYLYRDAFFCVCQSPRIQEYRRTGTGKAFRKGLYGI